MFIFARGGGKLHVECVSWCVCVCECVNACEMAGVCFRVASRVPRAVGRHNDP